MENERFIIVFNGEVYNHLEIRQNLIYNQFRTTSDTAKRDNIIKRIGSTKSGHWEIVE